MTNSLRVVSFTGPASTGKDTLASAIKKHFGLDRVTIAPFADEIRWLIVRMFGVHFELLTKYKDLVWNEAAWKYILETGREASVKPLLTEHALQTTTPRNLIRSVGKMLEEIDPNTLNEMWYNKWNKHNCDLLVVPDARMARERAFLGQTFENNHVGVLLSYPSLQLCSHPEDITEKETLPTTPWLYDQVIYKEDWDGFFPDKDVTKTLAYAKVLNTIQMRWPELKK